MFSGEIMKVFIGLLLGIASFSSYAIDLTKSLSPLSYMTKDEYAESLIENKKLQDKQKKEQALRDQQTQCEASRPYSLYRASENIYHSLSLIIEKEEAMQKLQRIEKTSGVINLNLRYSLAAIIENSKDQINYNFPIYKSLGGTASTPSGVKRITNPCPK